MPNLAFICYTQWARERAATKCQTKFLLTFISYSFLISFHGSCFDWNFKHFCEGNVLSNDINNILIYNINSDMRFVFAMFNKRKKNLSLGCYFALLYSHLHKW